MYTVDEVIEQVVRAIKDTSYTEANILKRLNEGLLRIALKVRIPELMQVDTVDTIDTGGVSITPLPADFHSFLYKCWSESHDRNVPVFEDRRMVDRKMQSNVDKAGACYGVARWGTNLYYQMIPSTAETLRIYYYQRPTDLVEGGDFPSYITEGLEEVLLGSYAKWRIFDQIEDGLEGEGAKPNTSSSKNDFLEALGEFILFHGPEPRDQKAPLNFMNFDPLF